MEDVPDRYRLYHHAAAYDGRDVLAEFIAPGDERLDLSDWFFEKSATTERSWKAHMADRRRHHALATPDDVETSTVELLEDRKVKTVCRDYWARVEQFYRWLQAPTEHPHVYPPVLMAAL